MAERFYVNCPLDVGAGVELTGPEARHLAVVRRGRPGDVVCLFNGDGRESRAEVAAVTKRGVALRVLAVAAPERELSFRLEVAAPLPKGDRAQFLVEKLTELGATALVPLRTRRSVVHPGEAKLGR
jgi:16S rRNA (uracil1498-N3)-methyltransferase